MYSKPHKDSSKISHQPNGRQAKISKAKALLDNRPITQLQKKGSSLIKKNVQNKTVQRVKSLGRSVEDRLVQAIEDGNKVKFKSIFRAAAPGMDEMISCATTYSKCRAYYKSGEEKKMRNFLRTSHKARYATHGMGHIVKSKGRIREFAHPTAKSKAFYARKRTAKGNPRWLNHTSWDRERSRFVGKSRSRRGMRDRSIEFSFNSGAQPPFARNSYKKRFVLDKEARELHNKRERMKRRHSRYDASRTQDYDATWSPKRGKRGISPDRGDL